MSTNRNNTSHKLEHYTAKRIKQKLTKNNIKLIQADKGRITVKKN